MVEILSELRKLRGKFLKDEGIYIFPKSDTITFPPMVVGTEPLESEAIDLSVFGGYKLFYHYNSQNVDVYVDFLSMPEPSIEGVSIKVVKVPANEGRIGILNEPHRWIKMKFWALENPSRGNFLTFVVRWGI